MKVFISLGLLVPSRFGSKFKDSIPYVFGLVIWQVCEKDHRDLLPSTYVA